MTTSPSDFDSRARTWDDDPAKRQRAERVAAAIASRVPALANKSVLEYGAGTGLLGLALRPLVAEVTLADVSHGMLEVANEKIAASGFHNVRTLPLDLSSGAIPNLRFDIVCTLMTLHHIPNTDAVLDAFWRLVSSRGFVCIADLDREDGSFHGAGFVGHKGFERIDLGARLVRTGFRDVQFETIFDVKKMTGPGSGRFPSSSPPGRGHDMPDALAPERHR